MEQPRCMPFGAMAIPEDVSYIDYETFLAPTFSPTAFANDLVVSTNNASDTAVDLSTPLSKVLFDIQEIDTHIHDLTAKSALPLLAYTRSQSSSAKKILDEASLQLATLTGSYKHLEEDVIARHAAAEEVRLAASRLWVTIKIGRAVGRCLLLGRQLEAQMLEVGQAGPGSQAGGSKSTSSRKDDHRAMVRACYTLLSLRALFAASGRDEEGEHLSRINVVNTVRTDLVGPAEQRLRTRAQQIVREFSLSTLVSTQPVSSTSNGLAESQIPATSDIPPSHGTATTVPSPGTSPFAQSEETKSRTTSASLTLYLLSPLPAIPATTSFQPTLLLAALQTYLQAQLTASAASLARALATLPTLPRALTEVSARCQNIVALEALLASTAPPPHPLLPVESKGSTLPSDATESLPPQRRQWPPRDLLLPLLSSLDTSSLPSFFWRSLAGQLSPKVAEIIGRGGVAVRALRNSKDRLRDSVREAVLKGCDGIKSEGKPGAWEREVGVMVGGILREIR